MKGHRVDPLFSHPIEDQPAIALEDCQSPTPVANPEFSHR